MTDQVPEMPNVADMKHAIIAIGFVLAGASDWGLVSRDTVICAVDRESCESAREAIRRGWLRDWPADARCVPLPGCFTHKSETIKGYNR